MQSTTLLFWNASTLQLADRRHVTIGHRYRHLVSLPSRPPPHGTTSVTIRHDYRHRSSRDGECGKSHLERSSLPHVTNRHRAMTLRGRECGRSRMARRAARHHHMSPSAIALYLLGKGVWEESYATTTCHHPPSLWSVGGVREGACCSPIGRRHGALGQSEAWAIVAVLLLT
ncbi:hypothetical protein J6590_104725 [Homalodisca vitripennis]|nr:hypothetical protein J6590_104725 [Homalodisca vitripennis]